MSADNLTPDGGLIRLFPLPNVVLFPGAMQPLHIFEPRYRQMTADALAGDRLIAMVLPRPGWEQDYAAKPVIHPVACVGRILTEQALADGRYNILLRGLLRVRLTEDVTQPKLYRLAHAQPLTDVPCSSAAEEAAGRSRLREQAPQWFESQSEVRDTFLELIASDLGLGALLDLVAFTLPLDAEFKQTLLEELHVARRLDRLLQQLGIPRRPFPPDFSAN
jgi:uncharacterized protein